MKLIIYRDRQTKKIKSYDDFRNGVTDEIVKAYNENSKYDTFAEIVELKEDSIAYFFHTMKSISINDEIESLRNLEEDLRELASDIDDRLYWIEKDIEKAKEKAKEKE